MPADLLSRFNSVMKLAEPMRMLVLDVLAADLFLLNFVDPGWTSEHLLPAMDQEGPAARSLLETWVVYGQVSDIGLFNRLRFRIEHALTDPTTPSIRREHLARLVTWASFTALAGNQDIAFNATDARRILSRCSEDCLKSVAWSLRQEVSGESDSGERVWRDHVRPFLDQVWPIDVDTLSPKVSSDLIRIPQGCGAAFDEAVDRISDLIVPLKLDSAMFGLDVYDDDNVFRDHPKGLLRLAWEAIDPGQPPPYDLEAFLTKIGAADVSLKSSWHFRRLSNMLRRV